MHPIVHKRSVLAWSLLAAGFALVVLISPPAGSADQDPITPIPSAEGQKAKIELGRKLFNDVRLSHSNSVACVSCHRLDRGGDDGSRRAIGADAKPLDFNSPTIFNVALNFRLNWRGNYRTLEEQNEAVLLDPPADEYKLGGVTAEAPG